MTTNGHDRRLITSAALSNRFLVKYLRSPSVSCLPRHSLYLMFIAYLIATLLSFFLFAAAAPVAGSQWFTIEWNGPEFTAVTGYVNAVYPVFYLPLTLISYRNYYCSSTF